MELFHIISVANKACCNGAGPGEDILGNPIQIFSNWYGDMFPGFTQTAYTIA